MRREQPERSARWDMKELPLDFLLDMDMNMVLLRSVQLVA
jgi:hypothetical protein